MRVTSGILGSHFGARPLWTAVLVSLALGIALALLLVPGSATADGPNEFTVPIVLEEGRTPPKVVEPPSVRDVPQLRSDGAQGNGASITQTSTLVSNTGKTAGASDDSFNVDSAQAFTTGSNSSGYTLTSVELNLKSTGTQATYSVTLHADSSGTPSTTSLGTLTTTTALTSNYGLVQFDAAGTGISLDANKTYWVLIDVSLASLTTHFQATTSGDQDSGAAAGWSIANTYRWRGTHASNWTNSFTQASVMHLRVNGSAKQSQSPQFTPPSSGDDGRRVAPGPWISPSPNRVDLSGTTVTVSMDKAVLLDSDYSEAQLAAKFTIWVNGDRVDAVGASVSGYQVQLDLGSAFSAPAGARVAVNYARGPLLDAAAPANQVGGFSYSPGPWYSPRPNRVDATATGVVVSMDKPVQLDSNYSASQLAWAFTVRVNGTAYTPTGASISGRDIHLTIGHPVADGDKLDVDYTRGPLQDSTGMRVGGFNYAGVGR